jgi:hypothetical protein
MRTECPKPSAASDLRRAHFPYDHRSIANIQLHAMVSDAQANSKPEGIAKPRRSLIHIWIRQHRNYGGGRYGLVRDHGVPRFHLPAD